MQQIGQAHQRLENMLTTVTNRAPPKLMRQVGTQLHKVQREALLRKKSMHVKDQIEPSQLKSQAAQMEMMEEKLADVEDLIDLNIENSFELQSQLSEKAGEIHRLKGEIDILTHKNQVDSDKLDNELITMRVQIHQLMEEATTQRLSMDQANKHTCKKRKNSPNYARRTKTCA